MLGTGKEPKNDENPKEVKPFDSSFDYWQQTAAYAIKQYKIALKWATKDSNLEWIKRYNQMWGNTNKIYDDEVMTQYTRSWQSIWEEFSIDSFNAFTEYWKKILVDYSEGTSKMHYETKEKLSEDWIKTWLKS